MSNSLDPDQAQQDVGPDLGPKCCKSYQQAKSLEKTKQKKQHQLVVSHMCFVPSSSEVMLCNNFFTSSLYWSHARRKPVSSVNWNLKVSLQS